MISSKFAKVGFVLVALATLASCGNTIRGMGADAANTVDATQAAGRNVDRAASR